MIQLCFKHWKMRVCMYCPSNKINMIGHTFMRNGIRGGARALPGNSDGERYSLSLSVSLSLSLSPIYSLSFSLSSFLSLSLSVSLCFSLALSLSRLLCHVYVYTLYTLLCHVYVYTYLSRGTWWERHWASLQVAKHDKFLQLPVLQRLHSKLQCHTTEAHGTPSKNMFFKEQLEISRYKSLEISWYPRNFLKFCFCKACQSYKLLDSFLRFDSLLRFVGVRIERKFQWFSCANGRKDFPIQSVLTWLDWGVFWVALISHCRCKPRLPNLVRVFATL